MTVTPDTIVVHVEPTDIPAATFVRVQVDAHSPAASASPIAYPGLAAMSVSINFLLAVFNHESTLATNPAAIVVRFDTRNPGNCRTLRPGSGARGVPIDTPRGQFVQYATWVDGWTDLSFRLTDPTYVYAQEGRHTIRQIIERFAPATDSNNPDAYVNAVVADMNRWMEPTVAQRIPKPPMTIRHSPRFDGYNHPREYRAIVDHIATGSKASNLSWLAGGSADAAQPSCNYYLAKDGTIYEIVPYAHAPWTNGVDFSKGIAAYKPNLKNPVVRYWFDNKINPNTGSVTTEHEGEASDRLTGAQLASDGWLKAWIHQETGIPLDAEHWFGHNFIDSVNRPYCPSFAPEEWDEMRQLALARLAGASVPPATPVLPNPPSELVLPGQPHGIPFTLGFRQHLLKIGNVVNPQDPALGALAVFGYARTAAYYADDGNAYQPTERYCLVYQSGQLPPWDIVGLHRGTDPPPPKRSD